MIKFYDHPKTGVLHFRASAGGGESGHTGIFDAPATHEHTAANPLEHGEYLRLKAQGSVALALAPSDIEARDLHIRDLEAQNAKLRAEVERLNGKA